MNERMLAAAVNAWAAMHRDELVRDLISLINIPSITGTPGCDAAADHLAEMAKRYGFAVERDGSYSVSVLHAGAKESRELGILGHIDVVPEGDGWKYAPYDAVEKEGWVIGRGSSDCKGPVVMCLYVLRCLREIGVELQSTVRLIAGTSEETDMADVQHYLACHDLPAYTLNCDGAWAGCIGEKGILEADLVLEMTDGNLLDIRGGVASNSVPADAYALLSHADPDALALAREKALVQETPDGIRIHVQGKAAHCCVPLQGENAIFKLLELLDDLHLLTGDAADKIHRLRQCFPDSFGTGLRIQHEDAVSGKTTCVGGLIRMENGRLIQNINVRSAVTQRGESLLYALKKRLSKLGIALENVNWSPPRLDSPDEPEVQILLDTCREFLDPNAKPYVMGGGTHSRLFPRSLPYGPGVMDPRRKKSFGEAHGADEAVCVDDLIRAIRVYVLALRRLDEYFEKEKQS